MSEKSKKEFWFEIPEGEGEEGFEDLRVFVGVKHGKEKAERKIVRKRREKEE